MTQKILIVDDDATLLRFLSEYLQKQDFAVSTAAAGADALRAAYRDRPDLVILDVMIPGMDGWEICARLRELADFPIILLTAKTSEADKLRGFRMGVDDYVTKPFSFAELTARIQAVLARSHSARKSENQLYAIRDLVMDMNKRQVYLGQQAVALTPTEFRLLECLAQRPGHAVSEETLARDVWGNYKQGDTTVVRRYIWLLRQKLEDDPANPKRLITVRGFGYRLGTRPLGLGEAPPEPSPPPDTEPLPPKE